MSSKQAHLKHDLLVVQRGEALPAKIRDHLQHKGFTTRYVTSTKEVLESLRELISPILLIHCGEKDDASEYLAANFLSLPDVLQFPVVVLGKDVDALESELNNHFSLATTLRTPLTPQDVLAAVNYIAKNYRSGRPEVPKIPTAAKEPPALDEDGVPYKGLHPTYASEASLPNLFFKQIREFKLLEKNLGGSKYPRQAHTTFFDEERFLPREMDVRNHCLSVMTQAGKWGRLHLERVAYLLDAMLQALTFPESLEQAIRAVNFLFTASFTNKDKSLLKKEYIGRGSLLLRKELCSRIKDSALGVGGSAIPLSADASKIIATFARLVGREQEINDDPITVAASLVMAADLTDRICFQTGNWNPRAAYSLMRRVKSGKMREIHPAVLCCVLKFISEALSAVPPAYLLAKHLRKNPELLEQARLNRENPVSKDETKITIDALSPGMKLSRPLFAFDGRKILSEDLTLDEDLIWRIWQLSAVRPLNSPVVVKHGEMEEESQSAE